ncbi:MAG: hypothetical protein Q4C13_03315 [Clostridia bacterium]|nr:hypothetical protein [Clostridia bacterium]
MFAFEKLCREYEALSFEELKTIVARESGVLLPALDLLEGDGLDMFLLFVATACASSGRLELGEYKLFEETTGLSVGYETVMAAVDAAGGRDAQEIVDSVADFFGVLDEELKASMIRFCLAFCAANGRIDAREKRFIRKLMRQSA